MANPTTNFGWQMPTNSDLVTDLPADFEVFGQAVDTTIKALNPSTTLGDIEYRSSTANTNTRLAIGSSGQVLTVSGGVPAWTTPAGGSMTLLASGTITTTLNLTSISGSYKSLQLRVIDYGNTSTSTIRVRFNSDSGSNYTNTAIYAGTGYTAAVTGGAGQTSVDLSVVDYAGSTNENHLILDIPNYTAAAYKVATWHNYQGISGGNSAAMGALGWKSTSAINEINIIFCTSGSYELYGVN